jgi:tetratricopeptide (TPR) repeat protein
MRIITRILFVTSLFFIGHFSQAQTNKEKALEKGHAAMRIEAEGKFDEAIRLLEEARKLDPDDINYSYEIAYAYYAKEDFKKAVKYLDDLLDHKDVSDLIYQLLGNCYDILKKQDKAIETYEAGLKKFPGSGKLYLELGNINVAKDDFNKAIGYYEKGIESEPDFPSNYYWASKIYCSSTEEVWGMIYGEIFMNLERNSKRTAEISKLLYNTYKSEIKFTSDSGFSVSFSKSATINISDLSSPDKIKLPFGIGVYEPTLMMATAAEKTIDLSSLDRIRKRFVDFYFQKETSTKYPNVLFDFQQELIRAGQMEAYNHWLLMKGDEEGFIAWQKENKVKWDAFAKWFNAYHLTLNKTSRFYRFQYN